MADAAPTEAQAAEADVDLLDDVSEAAAADAAPAESKPDAKASGDDGKGEPADLLADDDDGAPEKADGQADADKAKAPETYEAFTMPEGVQVDEAALAKATPIFKDIGLDQAQAQKLVSHFAQMQLEAQQLQLRGFNQVKKDWQAELTADADFGGDNLKQTTGAAKDVLMRFGDAKLRSDLKEWGWSNHPGLIKLLARVKAKLSDDTLVTADTTAQPAPKQTLDQVLWPSNSQKQE